MKLEAVPLLALLAFLRPLWAQSPLDAYLTEIAHRYLEKRDAELARLDRTAAERRQRAIREHMARQIGPFPAQKTPLNPRITGGFTRPDYRVENLIFESRPQFFVTANVYVPLKRKPPFAAVLGLAGHSANGKAAAVYQHVWISLAKRGFLVLAIDPPGQGERSESFDPETETSRAGIGVQEHILAGTQTLLSGTTFASYEIYDSIRAVDYLRTRPDVDPARIAAAGNSGGGTQAAYLAVFEPRLAAIVSSCYMTSWKQLWSKPGPQDAEQVFPGFLRDGFDFADFAFAAAPKPFLLTAAVRDFFPIEGARNTYQEIKTFYRYWDAERKAGYFEYDDQHGWSKPRREAAYRWLEKWLHGKEDSGEEGDVITEPEQLLYVTRTGQLRTSEPGETVQSLNAKQAQAAHSERTALGGSLSVELVKNRIALPAREGRPLFHKFDYRKPAAVSAAPLPAVVSLNATRSDLDEMLASGQAVLDLQFGASSSPRPDSSYTPAYQTASRALLVGHTLVGLWVSDVIQALAELKRKPEIDPRKITLYARGNAAVAAVHAQFLTREFHHVVAEAMPLSYLAIAQAKFHRGLMEIVVPGVLRHYDLPDLVALADPSRVTLADTRSPAGRVLLIEEVQRVYPGCDVRYRPEGWSFRQVYAGLF
ncbi:MAG: S9 family peptidase [Bryobacteraceae bacterium]|nr:S9 family peptidase [Bryobacteraceae bacterium]MDW8377178.1 alpha/beta hydrolase family protein [Bryobacterales bacterium]